jgi:cyclase
MRRVATRLLWLVPVLAAAAAIYVYHVVTSLETERVTDDVHVIFGAGGNVGVLSTSRGAAVVDTMTFRIQGERIRERAEALAGKPVQVVINTHYHRDHTHGNPGFPPGTRVVATDRTREHLLALDGAYWSGDDARTLPNETFTTDHEIRLGGKTIRVIHPGRGHTDGDAVVLFAEDRVIHMGDLLFNERYPSVDLEAGGSIQDWIGTLDRVLELDFDAVIPGHGPVTDREGIRRFQALLRELWQVGQDASRNGWSLQQTLDNARLTKDAGYQVISVPFLFRIDRDFVIGRVWEEATGKRRE